MELCPRQWRCTRCGVTHVLLPVTALLRRADTAAVIVSALATKATTPGGVSPSRCGFDASGRDGVGLAAPVCPAGRGDAFGVHRVAGCGGCRSGDAGCGRRGVGRRGDGDCGGRDRNHTPFLLPKVSLSETAVAVSGGRLLAPGWPGEPVQHESTQPAALITP